MHQGGIPRNRPLGLHVIVELESAHEPGHGPGVVDPGLSGIVGGCNESPAPPLAPAAFASAALPRPICSGVHGRWCAITTPFLVTFPSSSATASKGTSQEHSASAESNRRDLPGGMSLTFCPSGSPAARLDATDEYVSGSSPQATTRTSNATLGRAFAKPAPPGFHVGLLAHRRLLLETDNKSASASSRNRRHVVKAIGASARESFQCRRFWIRAAAGRQSGNRETSAIAAARR